MSEASDSKKQNAELLRDLGQSPELIAANSQIDLPTIKAWLKSGRWPGPRQLTLFDFGGSPSETTQPVGAEDDHGLSLFANPTSKSETIAHTATRSGVTF